MGSRRPLEKLETYTIDVDGWSYLYSYIAEPRSPTEVDEFVHLETVEFQGSVVDRKKRIAAPARIKIACEKVTADGEPSRYDRPVLGNLVAKKKLVEAYVILPVAHVNRLTSVAASGRITRISIMATEPIGRKALVRSIGVSTG